MKNIDFSHKSTNLFPLPNKKTIIPSKTTELSPQKEKEPPAKSYFLKPKFSNIPKLFIPNCYSKTPQKPFELFPNHSINTSIRKSFRT